MAPSSPSPLPLLRKRLPTEKPVHADALVLEAWAQGYLVGSLVIMAFVTVANMRQGVLLHKLILVELVLGMFHGTFIFTHPPVYGWYLSTTAILLNLSWSLHNVVAWLKTKPFLSRRWSRFYIVTVLLAQPYWVLEVYANFAYFNGINDIFRYSRPYEALFRDPWWIFTACNLLWNITNRYSMPLTTVIRISPRFGVLLVALLLSIVFIIVDICAVTGVFDSLLPDGLNPFWKLATVFKALTDSIVLDDFKTALDRLMRHKLQREAIASDAWTFPPQPDYRGASPSTSPPAPPPPPLSPMHADPHPLWRIQSIATAREEDPLGDESLDRARNREAAEPGSPFARSAKILAEFTGTGLTPTTPRVASLRGDAGLADLDVETARYAAPWSGGDGIERLDAAVKEDSLAGKG